MFQTGGLDWDPRELSLCYVHAFDSYQVQPSPLSQIVIFTYILNTEYISKFYSCYLQNWILALSFLFVGMLKVKTLNLKDITCMP